MRACMYIYRRPGITGSTAAQQQKPRVMSWRFSDSISAAKFREELFGRAEKEPVSGWGWVSSQLLRSWGQHCKHLQARRSRAGGIRLLFGCFQRKPPAHTQEIEGCSAAASHPGLPPSGLSRADGGSQGCAVREHTVLLRLGTRDAL